MMASNVLLALHLTVLWFGETFGQTEFNFSLSTFNFSLSTSNVMSTIGVTENTQECGVFPRQCNIVDYWGGADEDNPVYVYGKPSCSQWPNLTWWGNISAEESYQFSEDYDGKFRKNRDKKFRTVMWFDDTIWSGTLSDYQTILQQSFTFAILDLHKKWRGSKNVTEKKSKYEDQILTFDDVYVNVTFFLGFCLLDGAECNVIKEDELDELEKEGKIEGLMDRGTYYVYSVIYTTKEVTRYVHYLLKTFKNDYMAFSSMRMQCDDFTGLLQIDENSEDAGLTDELAYQGWAYYVSKIDDPGPWEVPVILNISVASFVGLCVLFAVCGALHGFVVWKADCIRISGIIYFGLYTWDFYSDIVFTLSLWDSYTLGITSVTLFWAAAVFVVIPWIANMIALSRYQNKWCKDETIRERVYQWFVSWQRLTYALAALSGSAFGTVELANSYVFGLDFFCMGLNERHLKKFNNNRLYSSILVENAPQICIQVIYLTRVVDEWDDLENEEIALGALAASTLSVGAALLDIYASKKLFSVLKKDGEYVGKTSCSIFVISSEIKQHATRLQISTYAFRDAIAETLSTHPRSVEMHFPIATSTGFKMKFTIFSSKLTPEVIYKAIKTGAESKLPKRIQQQWRLIKPVAIPTDRIEVEKVDNANDAEEGLSAPLSSNIGGGQVNFEGGKILSATNDDDNDNNNNNNNNETNGNIENVIQLSNKETDEEAPAAIPIRKGRLSRAGEKS